MTALRWLSCLTFLLLACGCQRTSFLETTTMAAENVSDSKKAGDAASPVASLSNPAAGSSTTKPAKLEAATFGEGCFWCCEAVFQRLRGVKSVVSGYSNGNVVKPTYEQVSSGRTGHAEVIQITYDPNEIK